MVHRSGTHFVFVFECVKSRVTVGCIGADYFLNPMNHTLNVICFEQIISYDDNNKVCTTCFNFSYLNLIVSSGARQP